MSNQSLREAAQQALDAMRAADERFCMHDIQSHKLVAAIESLRTALAKPDDKAQPVASRSSFWLIERGPNQGQTPHVWWSSALGNISSGTPHGDWTNETNKATRFATKEAAEQAVIDLSITYCTVTSHIFIGKVATQPVTSSEDLRDAVSKALSRAYGLGQTYWRQADSESWSQNKKADETQRRFDALVDDTRALLAPKQQDTGQGVLSADEIEAADRAARGGAA